MIKYPKVGCNALLLRVRRLGGRTDAMLCRRISIDVNQILRATLLDGSCERYTYSECSHAGNDYEGYEVRSVHKEDYVENVASKTVIKKSEIEVEERKMEQSIILATVRVRLSENFGKYTDKEYDYKTYLDLHEGDHVVVETKFGPALGVVSGFGAPTVEPYKWVIEKVNFEAHGVRKSMISEALQSEEATRKQSKLYKDIQARANDVKKRITVTDLAQIDPSLAEMLEKYKARGTHGGTKVGVIIIG